MPRQLKMWRVFSPEKNIDIQKEVDKLQKANFIEDVMYLGWSANVMMVKKKNNKWPTCVGFTELNKYYLKDHFHFPIIDQLVDAKAGHELLSFIDAYSGYNKTKMNPSNRKKTSFDTNRDTYCYNIMPLGFKTLDQHTKGW